MIDGEFWVTVGNATYSEQLWGIKKSKFPLTYLCPPAVASVQSGKLVIPDLEGILTGFAGLAFEIKGEARNISLKEADGYISGIRLWTGLYSSFLTERLKKLGHQITLRDYGLGVYYGQWIEDFQVLGELLPLNDLEEMMEIPVKLLVSDTIRVEEKPKDYKYSPQYMTAFFSRFMTLNKGDVFTLGALCGFPLKKGMKKLVARWGSTELTADLLWRKNKG